MLAKNLPFNVTICRLQKHVEKLRQASFYLRRSVSELWGCREGLKRFQRAVRTIASIATNITVTTNGTTKFTASDVWSYHPRVPAARLAVRF
jgi:isoleucyl-tRNA synthetase